LVTAPLRCTSGFTATSVLGMAKATVVSFTISHEGAKLKPAKSFTLKSGFDVAVRIGRAPGNDIVVDHRGASQYHCELRLLADDNGGGNHRLHIRDLSMNGTGMRKAEGKQPECLEKQKNEPVPDGAVLLVPMMLKAPSTPADRAWLKVDFQDPPAEELEKRPAAGRRQEESDEPVPPASGPAANDGSASEQEEKDAEKNRMKFVDLLLKTREVSAGTTYDEARRLLSNNDAWHAVDESTRRECFEIFVEHLGNHHKKSKKKEKSGKAKKEKRRRRDDDEDHATGREPAEASSKGRRRRDGERKGGSDSPDRGHRKGGGSKRDKKGRDGRDKSRGRSAGNYSRSLSRPQKKRRRGRSGSA